MIGPWSQCRDPGPVFIANMADVYSARQTHTAALQFDF